MLVYHAVSFSVCVNMNSKEVALREHLIEVVYYLSVL